MNAFRRAAIAGVAVVAALLGGLTGIAPANATNTPGIEWTSRTSLDNEWTTIAYGGGIFVALARDRSATPIMTSVDGITWTPRAAPVVAMWSAVTYGNGQFVAVARGGATDMDQSGSVVMTSPDGINWTSRPSAPNHSWFSVTYGNGLFVAVTFGDLQVDAIMTSPDGITWTTRAAPNTDKWNAVTFGNGRFVAVAVNGTAQSAMTSTDGINWTVQSTPTDSEDRRWAAVTYGNNLFVATAQVGVTKKVMTSPDGETWTLRDTPASAWWMSVTYGNGLFVTVGFFNGPQIMTSPDGITWTTRSSPSDNHWMSVAYGNGLFAAVSLTGSGNRVMTSGVVSIAPTIRSVSITGTPASGQTLTARTLGLSGSPAPSLTYTWQSSVDQQTWKTAQSSSAATFKVPASLNGQYIRVRVAATNGVSPNATTTSSAVKLTLINPPTAAKNVAVSVKGMTIKLTWKPGTSDRRFPITAYAPTCSIGEERIRTTVSSTKRSATLTATRVGEWTCRVAAVSDIGRSTAEPVKATVKK